MSKTEGKFKKKAGRQYLRLQCIKKLINFSASQKQPLFSTNLLSQGKLINS